VCEGVIDEALPLAGTLRGGKEPVDLLACGDERAWVDTRTDSLIVENLQMTAYELR
jgi:hypothetical protein